MKITTEQLKQIIKEELQDMKRSNISEVKMTPYHPEWTVEYFKHLITPLYHYDERPDLVDELETADLESLMNQINSVTVYKTRHSVLKVTYELDAIIGKALPKHYAAGGNTIYGLAAAAAHNCAGGSDPFQQMYYDGKIEKDKKAKKFAIDKAALDKAKASGVSETIRQQVRKIILERMK